MYKSLLFLTIALMLGGAFYYFHINYPDFFTRTATQYKVDSGIDDALPSHVRKAEERRLPAPNPLMADSLKGMYVSTDGAEVELIQTGSASYTSSDNVTSLGLWSIDDTGTITFLPNNSREKSRLFDVDQSTKSIIEVSSPTRKVYIQK